MRNKTYIFVILMLVAAVAVPSVHGQIIYDQPGAGYARMIYSHWKLEDDSGEISIGQIALPISGFIPLKDNLEAQFYMANASNKMSVIDSDTTLSGFSDARFQINHSFYEDHFLISGGINLPVGKKKLNTSEERAVIDLLSENYLSFPMRRLGEGFGFNLLFGAATILGETRWGTGIMYQYNGSYDAYEGEGSYDPGDFASINISAGKSFEKTAFNADVIFTMYGKDKLDDVDAYDASAQMDFRLRTILTEEKYSLGGNFRYLYRFKPTVYDIMTGGVIGEEKLYGNEFFVNGNLNYHPDPGWYVAPSVDLRLIGDSETGIKKSTIFGFGGLYGRKLNEKFDFDIGLKYFLGSADDGDIDLTGLQITLGLAAIF